MSGNTYRRSGEHLREVEELLEPIRYDRTIDEAERRRLITDVLATANARALSLWHSRREAVEPGPRVVAAPIVAHEVEVRRWKRGLARVG